MIPMHAILYKGTSVSQSAILQDIKSQPFFKLFLKPKASLSDKRVRREFGKLWKKEKLQNGENHKNHHW